MLADHALKTGVLESLISIFGMPQISRCEHLRAFCEWNHPAAYVKQIINMRMQMSKKCIKDFSDMSTVFF